MNADFVNANSALDGGAISNNGTLGKITGDFIGNKVDYNYLYSDQGGAIYNSGTIDSISGNFIDNAAERGGNAIDNIGSINSISGDFIANHSYEHADLSTSAIYNKSEIGSITGNFVNNYATVYNTSRHVGNGFSGAINNSGTIKDISGNFIGNQLNVFSTYSAYAYSGAIYNSDTIGKIIGDFIGNSSEVEGGWYNNITYAYGGAIYNSGTMGDIIGNFIDNYSYNNQNGDSFTQGGAIYNSNTMGKITGDFVGNYTKSDKGYGAISSYLYGGAIYNSGIFDDIKGNFIGNHVENIVGKCIGCSYDSYGSGAPTEDYNVFAFGGAVYNDGSSVMKDLTGDFINNYTSAASTDGSYIIQAKGGAVYNKGTLDNITGNFVGNHASATGDESFYTLQPEGGAIYNSGKITVTGNTQFTDNYVEKNGTKTSNAIHNTGTIDFKGENIVVNDKITGENGTINIAGIDEGMITFNNLVSGNDINLESGVLRFGHYNSALFGSSFGSLDHGTNFVVKGGMLSLADNEVNTAHLGNIRLESDLNYEIDINVDNNTHDTITVDSVTKTGDYSLVLTKVNFISDTGRHITDFKIDDLNGLIKFSDKLTVTNGNNIQNTYLAEVDETTNKIKFGNVKALETAVQFKAAAKNYDMTGDVADLQTDLGVLKNDGLNISGNGHTIDGGGFGGMSIANGQTVSLSNVSVKGFNGAFAENNGTMNFTADNGNQVNLNSEISGSGVINVGGEGAFNFNSAIAAGKMNVSGGELNWQNGSELANVENFIANGGVLNVGDQTISLKNAEFNDGSTVKIKVKSDGNGKITADSIKINGGALKATLGQGIIESGSKIVTLLESGTSFTDNFDSVADNNMYRFEKASKAGDYIISLAKTAEEVSKENGGSSNNSDAAKGWVDGSKFEDGSVSADVADKLADLAQNDADKFNEALSALAPSDTPQVRTNSVNHNTEMFKAVVTHLDDGYQRTRNGLSSGDGSSFDGVSVWVKAFGNHTKVDDTAKAYGFKSDGYGATIGLEKQLTDAVKAGVGYSYFYNDVDGFMRDSDVNTHTGFVYGEYRPNNWYVNTIASYGYSDYDETKHVAGAEYKAKYDVDNIGAQVMTGYNAKVANVEVTPETGLRYNNIHRDDYVDGAGQAVKAETMDVMTAVAGVKVGKDLVSCFGLKEVYWRPEARLAATYDVISDKENAVVSLSNGSGYIVKGQRLNRFGIEAGAGVTFYLSPDVESSVGYEGKFRKDYQDHTGYVSAKYKF